MMMGLVTVQHIEQTPGVRGGKPHIAGTRITVADVAFCHLQQGLSVAEIAAEYDLSLASVHAALAYYFDHRAEIDHARAEDEAYAAEFAREHPSILPTKLSRRRDR